jgi:hypothetical protein
LLFTFSEQLQSTMPDWRRPWFKALNGNAYALLAAISETKSAIFRDVLHTPYFCGPTGALGFHRAA